MLEVMVLMPEEDGLFSEGLVQGEMGVMVAIRPGEHHDSEFHGLSFISIGGADPSFPTGDPAFTGPG